MNKLLVLFFLLPIKSVVYSQVNETYQEGLALEKEFNVKAALEKYESVIKLDPNHSNALTHASRMLSNLGGQLPQTELDKKNTYYKKALLYAEKSVALEPRNAEARLAYTISMGLISEVTTNPYDKVRYANQIHQQATEILRIDSTYAEAYFILGKWQLELSRLNWMEMTACKLFLGGFPEEISLKQSLRYFELANNYRPNYILFMYGLASAQEELGDHENAIKSLQKALSLPISEPDDISRKDRCQTLLNKIMTKG